MKRTSYAFSTAAIALLAACPSPEGNPAQLWLAPDGSEVILHLVAEEPDPW